LHSLIVEAVENSKRKNENASGDLGVRESTDAGPTPSGATGRMYSSKAAAEAGVASVQTNAPSQEVTTAE